MNSIGLTYEQIDKILKESISLEKTVNSETIRDVIAKAILENNKKILEDLKEIFKAN